MTFLLCSILLLAAPDAKTASDFIDVVQANFARWDLNHNGTLSPEEIDRLVVEQSIRGDEAAAIGAIKTMLRLGYSVPPMTLDYFKSAAEKPKKTKDASGDHRPEVRMFGGPDWNKGFTVARKRIADPNRDLFRNQTVDLKQFKQGALGDCYFVSMIGALVNKQHDTVRKMITVQRNGDLKVSFADNETIVVPPMTDAEIATSSTTGEEGTWVAVFEKAFGTLRQAQFPEVHKEGVASDAIAFGGTLETTIRVLTGHDSESFRLKSSVQVTGATDYKFQLKAQPQDLARMTRDKLKAAVAKKKLVGASTLPEDLPPGIPDRHAYAVVGYEPQGDIVVIWNPHGNTFKPKGAPGLENGYPTEFGMFKVPMKEFVQIFGAIEIELDVSATTTGVRSGKTSGGK
ncbi:MAG: C2 family cysteine protease [Phycisphaerales bacterium]